jgi:hypothetical protein
MTDERFDGLSLLEKNISERKKLEERLSDMSNKYWELRCAVVRHSWSNWFFRKELYHGKDPECVKKFTRLFGFLNFGKN